MFPWTSAAINGRFVYIVLKVSCPSMAYTVVDATSCREILRPKAAKEISRLRLFLLWFSFGTSGGIDVIMEELCAMLLPVLVAVLITMGLCRAVGRHKRPAFWLAAPVALVTGVGVFWFFFGNSVFTDDFWNGFNCTLTSGWDLFSSTLLPWVIISFVPSIGVVFIYRRCRELSLPK
jgi:hypothetical protein